MVKKQERCGKVPFSLTKAIIPKDLSNLTDVQWARIAPEKVIIATKEHAWLYRPRSAKERFAQPMMNDGSVATTQKLLDGSIAAAKYAVKSKEKPPALTPTRRVWRLAGAYHLCHPTFKLMKEATLGFYLIGRTRLAEWATQKAKKEAGRDRLALFDIQSMGYYSEAVVKALVPSAAVALIDYFTRSVRDWNPIDCVGYSYTMERLAIEVGEEYIQKVEVLLPLKIDATRNMHIHSSVSADIEHVEETVEMVAKLTAKERTRVAVACYETALMCFSPPQDGYISDEKLRQILKPLKLDKSL